MKNIVFLLLFSTLAFASNPKVYSSLGDEIYDGLDNVMKLKSISGLEKGIKGLTKYKQDVLKAKEVGFNIQNNKSTVNKSSYLKTLRALGKKRELYVREVNSLLQKSMKSENSKDFNDLMQTGLIDAKKNRRDILNYYRDHKSEVTLSPSMKNLLDSERKSKKSRANSNAKNSKQSLESKRVQRIRASDKREQEALEKTLQEESDKKKLEIRNNHRRELKV